jgi:NADH-quinone oxidoreductase subunit M
MASLGLPGLGNFIAEFLTLVGAWSAAPVLTIMATVGLIAATVYSLRILQKVFMGPAPENLDLKDLNMREKVVLVPMVVLIIFLGVYPQPVLNVVRNAIDTIGSVPEKVDNVAVRHEKGGQNE